jgi:hypothetical protein
MHSPSLRYLTLAVAVATSLLFTCAAQEVASIDLTKISARMDLRRPQAASPSTGGYSGATEQIDCRNSEHKLGLLRTSVVSLDRTHYLEGDESTFEVTVENAGSSPIHIPFSPHLADLQPKDPAQKFAYSTLQIVLWIAAGEQWSSSAGGGISLYGDDHRADTMLTLNPGQWARIIGNGRFGFPLGNGRFGIPRDGLSDKLIHSHEIDRVYAQATLYREETLITPKQSATVRREVCVAQTHGQTVPIQLVIP